MIILIHTSKTMRPPAEGSAALRAPELAAKTTRLAAYLQTVPAERIAAVMKISPKLAEKTHQLLTSWTSAPSKQRCAIDSFLGDIYSGLQVADWTTDDRLYADDSLRILSGLYGVLRPLDGIHPYRLEMAYRLDDPMFSNLYTYWDADVAATLPHTGMIINLAAVEYSRLISPYVDEDRIITPGFLTISPKTDQPTFVVVHAKIARGAFASWLIRHRVNDLGMLKTFKDLNYAYDDALSTPKMPVFVCKSFGGLGLSVRLK